MDNDATTPSTLETLRTVEFRLGLKGYNVDEVDEYLEKAAVEAEQVQERLRTANDRLRQATERVAQLEVEIQRSSADRTAAPHSAAATQPGAPEATAAQRVTGAVSDETLQRTLLLAQKFVDQTKRECEAEAAQVVGRAEERARAMLAQAEEHARRLTNDAENRLREEVARLEATRARLVNDVDALSRHLDEQRTKIRASLNETLRWVDERLQAAPARGGAEQKPADSSAAAGSDAPRGAGPDVSGAPVASRGASQSSPAAAVGGVARPQVAPRPPAGRPQGPSAAPGGSQERQVPAQTPVGARLGVLEGGLFGSGGSETDD